MTSSERDVGAVADFPGGRPLRIEVDGRSLSLVRRGHDFYALRDICPHQGGRLSAGTIGGVARAAEVGGPVTQQQQGLILRCPWHGWAYNVATGCSLVEPERVRVRAFPVRVEAGRVIVDVG